MATTVTVDTLIARAPAFKAADEACIQFAIDEAVLYTNETNWGAKFNNGVFYLACHILTESLAFAAAGLEGGVSALPAGGVTSEKIDEWAATYGGLGNAFEGEALATTAWGRSYIARRKTIFSRRILC